MPGFSDLLGTLIQNGVTQSGSSRMGNALGEQGLGQAGGILADLLGGRSGTASGGGGGGGNDLLGSLLGAAGSIFGQGGSAQSSGGGFGNLGTLAGSIFGGGPSNSSQNTTMGGGAMAMLAGLALKALLKGRGGNAQSAMSAQALPLGLRAPENADEEKELELSAELALRAMLSAAKADGTIGPTEMAKITGKAQEAQAADDTLAFLQQELHAPLDLDGLLAAVPNEQLAAQVYAASLFAIEVDTPEEEEYLRRLAAGLALEPAVVSEIHSALGVPAV